MIRRIVFEYLTGLRQIVGTDEALTGLPAELPEVEVDGTPTPFRLVAVTDRLARYRELDPSKELA